MSPVASPNSRTCSAVTVRVMLADMPGLSSSRNTLVIDSPGPLPDQFASCAARCRPKPGEQGCQMFVSIRCNVLAMNPIGDKQRLQARDIGALDIGEQPIAHRQGAPRRMPRKGAQQSQSRLIDRQMRLAVIGHT